MAKYNGSFGENSAPRIYYEGVKDNSSRKLPKGPQNVPICSSLVFTYSESGPTKAKFMSASDAITIYGEKSFEENGPFTTSQTKLINIIAQCGSSCTFQRIVPEDAKKKANVVIYYDLLHTDIPNYVRKPTGDYEIDATTKMPKLNQDNPTVKGFKVKLIAEYLPDIKDGHDYGTLTAKTGTMSVQTVDENNEPTTMRSTMYPILEIVAPYYGKKHNLTGFSIDTVKGKSLDKRYITTNKSLLYEFSIFQKENEYSSPEVVRTLFEDTAAKFMFKPNAESPIVKGTKITFNTAYPIKWVNITATSRKLVPEIFEKVFVYEENLEAISTLIYELELKSIYSTANADGDMNFSWYDFTTSTATPLHTKKNEPEPYTMDIFNLRTLSNVPYKHFIFSKESTTLESNQEEVMISKKTPVFLKGGTDGTMSRENFELEIRKIMKQYMDKDHPIQNMNTNVTNTIWDTGFELETKLALCGYLTERPDGIIWFSTFIDGWKQSVSDQLDVGAALSARLNLYPESLLHGTRVCRAVIMLGDAVFVGNNDTSIRKSINYEMAYKVHKMMGSAQVKFLYENKFDGGEGAELKIMYDYKPEELRESVKDILWGNTLNWAEPKSGNGVYAFPAIQSVFGDQTSSLRNIYMLYGISYISRVANYVFTEHKGTSSMSHAMLKQSIENMTENILSSAFSGILKYTQHVEYTEDDMTRGNSYKHNFDLGGPNIFTTALVSLGAFRLTPEGEIDRGEEQ